VTAARTLVNAKETPPVPKGVIEQTVIGRAVDAAARFGAASRCLIKSSSPICLCALSRRADYS
jgi:hypothetical protein